MSSEELYRGSLSFKIHTILFLHILIVNVPSQLWCQTNIIGWVLSISTSKRMLAHAFAWLKTIENTRKCIKKYLFHHAHERLTKKNKEKRSKKFVGQRLGVTPNSWLTPKHWLLIWNFVVFCYRLAYLCHQCLLV